MGSKGWWFALVALAVLAGMHWVLWRGFARALPERRGWRVALATALALLAALVALNFGVARRLGESWPRGLALGTWLWFAFVFYAVLGFGALALVRGGRRVLAGRSLPDQSRTDAIRADAIRANAVRADAPRREAPESAPNPARRALLARTAAASVGIGSAVIVGTGFRRTLTEPETPEIELPLARLPRELEGLRVVQITDLHLAPLFGADECALTVERVNRLKPDLVVLTGDIVDAPVHALRHAAAPLAALRARHGVLFVTGNHEYYCGADEWLAEFRRLGMRTLVNERVSIGDAGASLDVVGLPDEWAGRHAEAIGPDAARALSGRDPERALLALVHRPTQAREIVRAGAGAAVCGHTHGGQMWPFHGLVHLVQPYITGLQREGEGLVYVSRGAGFWGPPVRVLAPPELPCFVLTRRA
jgi:uncharacterized protein